MRFYHKVWRGDSWYNSCSDWASHTNGSLSLWTSSRHYHQAITKMKNGRNVFFNRRTFVSTGGSTSSSFKLGHVRNFHCHRCLSRTCSKKTIIDSDWTHFVAEKTPRITGGSMYKVLLNKWLNIWKTGNATLPPTETTFESSSDCTWFYFIQKNCECSLLLVQTSA